VSARGGRPSRARITGRRLVGLDRSGPEPPATRRGQPLRPFTIPNAIGYLRVAAVPVFLYLAFESGDGRTAASAILYAAICGTDYLDGLVARATGQYSRMGAILDPVVDRLAVLSGVAVCWHFELVPRWALVVLAVREVVTLVLAQLALRRGLDLEINWLGRIGVILVMGGIFIALVAETLLSELVLYTGIVFSILATVLYIRVALAKSRPVSARG
jgi:CDP-diacylglycerol--glycerol-3-phosphate 3-phosphatidyltransferase